MDKINFIQKKVFKKNLKNEMVFGVFVFAINEKK
jgi:hypothetical protein